MFTLRVYDPPGHAQKPVIIDPLRVAHVDDTEAALDLDAGLANVEPVQTRLIGYVIGCASVAVLDQGGNEQGALSLCLSALCAPVRAPHRRVTTFAA